jgi:5,10-methylenetetrahydromethanopterin reductase
MTDHEKGPRLGAMFVPTAPLAGLLSFVDRVEALGFDELWFAEDCFEHGAFSAAALSLERTSSLTVGIGLLPVGLRNPAVAAMEIATIACLYPGRLKIAFGHGVEGWMRQVGARPRNRLTYMRNVAASVSRLVRGEDVTNHTGVRLDRVRLAQPPDRIPQFSIGTTGVLGAQLAAELDFGLLMPEGAGTAAVRWAREVLRPASPVTVYSWFSIADDEAAAKSALLPEVRSWRSRDLYPRLYEFGRLPEADAITADMLSEVAVVGTAKQCARQIEALHNAGADTVVLIPIGGDPLGILACISRDVATLLPRPS